MYQIHSCALFRDKMVLLFVCINITSEKKTKLDWFYTVFGKKKRFTEAKIIISATKEVFRVQATLKFSIPNNEINYKLYISVSSYT